MATTIPSEATGVAPRAFLSDGNTPGEPFIELDLRRWTAIARRNRLLIAGVVSLGVLIALLISMLIVPQYTAASSIQIDQEADRVLESDTVQPQAAYQDVDRFLQTQVSYLRSRTMAERVARDLSLVRDTPFLTLTGLDSAAEIESGQDTPANRRARVVGILAQNIAVDLPLESRVATIAFTSPNAALSARIANSYAREFIKANLQRKFDSSAYAREFLGARIAEARDRLETAEQRLSDFDRSANLVRLPSSSEDGGAAQTVTAASLVQINQATNAARDVRVTAEQRWNTIRDRAPGAIPAVQQNSAYQSLMVQRTQIATRYSEERARHLPGHPSVIELQSQLDEIDTAIDSFAQSIKEGVRTEYLAAAARERELASEVNSLQDRTLREQRSDVQYSVLRREADTNRNLYDVLLQRYNELNASAGISNNNVALIDAALPPAAPSSPNLPRNLALGFVGGLVLAFASVLVREQYDDRVRGPFDVESKLGLPVLGVVPSRGGTDAILEVRNDPTSMVTESLVALRTTLNYTTPEGFPESLQITSSRPGEGKSTVAIALGLLSARAGIRTLLIDADLRRPTLHRRLDLSNAVGLTDLITGQSEIDDVIRMVDGTDLSVVTSGPLPPNPTDLLSSPRMADLVRILKGRFDVVLIDGPPVIGLADAPLIGRMTAHSLFVIEASNGRRGATKNAIRRLRQTGVEPIGAVLNKFDPRQAGSEYSYYGSSYYEYRSE